MLKLEPTSMESAKFLHQQIHTGGTPFCVKGQKLKFSYVEEYASRLFDGGRGRETSQHSFLSLVRLLLRHTWGHDPRETGRTIYCYKKLAFSFSGDPNLRV